MKILELAPYVFIEDHKHGSRNKSGLAYMIRSICDMLGTRHDVHVLTQSVLTTAQVVSGWHLVKRNFSTILFHFKFTYLTLAFKMSRRDKSHGVLRQLFYCISAGQAEDYIKKWRPDVVHIHGIGSYSLPYYYAAAKCNVPVVSTLHGLLSFHSIVPAPLYQKELERHFLKMCVDNNYSMTFISSGMKKKVQEFMKKECSSITVIPNCYRNVEINYNKNTSTNEYVIICVGSVYPLKNQIQTIRALPIVREKVAPKKVMLKVYGDGESIGEWSQYCVDKGIDGVEFLGRKPQDTVFEAITQADLLVFPSIEEGFGIPIVEAYCCGTPVVTFRDLDAAPDIDNDNCCVFAADRSDEALAEAIVKALNKEWDIRKIKTFSKNFSLESTALKYCSAIEKEHEKWDLNIIKKHLLSTL